MNKSKQDLINEFLNSPVKIGDTVSVRGLGTSDKTKISGCTKVVKLGDNNSIFINEYNSLKEISVGDYIRSTDHIGVDPFQTKGFLDRIRVISSDIDGLLARTGFYPRYGDTGRKTTEINGVAVPELSDNPYVIDKNNNKVFYQRGLVWKLEQKQNLINSIYKGIEIGKFVIRKRSFDYVEKQVKLGNEKTAFKDLVDGKQRYNTICDFVEDKFVDSYGNLFSDLTKSAQNKFFNSMNLTYCELDENTNDRDVLDTFLNINVAGVVIDKEHIKFVESIEL